MRIKYIRLRTFSGIVCFPAFVLIAVSGFTKNNSLLIISFFLVLSLLFLSLVLHDFIINDLSCWSYIISGRIALEKGYDPLPNRKIDMDRASVTQLYLSFEHAICFPQKDSSGFVIYTYENIKRANKILFYEYNGSDFITVYDIYFSDCESFFDQVKEKQISIKKIKRNMRFVELTKN